MLGLTFLQNVRQKLNMHCNNSVQTIFKKWFLGFITIILEDNKAFLKFEKIHKDFVVHKS